MGARVIVIGAGISGLARELLNTAVETIFAKPESDQADLLCVTKKPALAAGALSTPGTSQNTAAGDQDTVSDPWFRARKIVGHPTGQGIAKGTARVIRDPRDLIDFTECEALVCQGVEPNITFVLPLAAAVVEERGAC